MKQHTYPYTSVCDGEILKDVPVGPPAAATKERYMSITHEYKIYFATGIDEPQAADHSISYIHVRDRTIKSLTGDGLEFCTEEVRGEPERARRLGEDGHDVVGQQVAVRRHEAVHVVHDAPRREVLDAKTLRCAARRLKETARDKRKRHERQGLLGRGARQWCLAVFHHFFCGNQGHHV